MQIVGKVRFKEVEQLLAEHGLNDGGEVQKFIDNEVMRQSLPYMPNLNGVLQNAMMSQTVIGSGEIRQNTPYARYQYYGVLFVDPITLKGSFYDARTGRHWSRKGVAKIPDPTGRLLNYNTSKNALAGSHWFDRAMKDHSESIGRAAAKLAKGRFVK
nr:MAG TPA: Minor capsid protein [Caudoviricetes sp.]